jgi:hypothetical protein
MCTLFLKEGTKLGEIQLSKKKAALLFAKWLHTPQYACINTGPITGKQ